MWKVLTGLDLSEGTLHTLSHWETSSDTLYKLWESCFTDLQALAHGHMWSISCQDTNKKSFFWGLLDNKSNFGHVGLLAVKNPVFPDYKKVEALWEMKSGNHIIAICMDSAKEFSLGNMGAYLKLQGITMQITAPYAHSQNGKAECFIHTIEDGAQTLLADTKLAMSFWGDAALTMNYLCK